MKTSDLAKLLSNVQFSNFNWKRYTSRKMYRGVEIQTSPLHTSTGLIGFIVDVYENGQHTHTIKVDTELYEVTIDGMREDEFYDMNEEEDFISKLAELCGEYNVEMDVLEARINGKKIDCMTINEPKNVIVDCIVVDNNFVHYRD